MLSDDEDSTLYVVVMNDEEQFSIWPKHKTLPLEWTASGKEGQKRECLAHIDEVWTDMRPLGLRIKMQEQSQ